MAWTTGRLLALIGTMIAGALAFGADHAQVEAWEKTAREGSVTRAYQEQYTKDLKPAEGGALMEAGTKAAEALLNEDSILKQPARFAEYACIRAELYVHAGELAAGETLFKRVVGAERAPQKETILAYMGLANIECMRGNKAKAAQYCRDLVSRIPPKEVRRRTTQKSHILQAQAAAGLLTGYSLDALNLPVDTGAEVFPTPKDAKYTQRFAPLGNVCVAGLKDDSPEMRLIKEKLTRFGIPVVKKAPFTIAVNPATLKAPEKPQGYALAVTGKGAQIAGADKLGVVWGIVSFIQVIDRKKKAVRICTVNDWPDGLRRGHTGWFANEVEYALFTKQNLCTGGPRAWFFPNAYENMRFPALQDAIVEAVARPFVDFGLDYYPCERLCQVPITTAQGYQWYRDRAAAAARVGAHTYYMWDDGRYSWLYRNGPYEIDRKRNGGQMAEIDAAFLNRLHKDLQSEFPGFKLLFCPPCYWGPDAPFEGPDNREKYLSAIGGTNPEIDVFWTGVGVLARLHTPEAVAWFRKLVKRGPVIFQNRTGQHESVNYLADTTDWQNWMYDGFAANDIRGFAKNSHMPTEGTQIATLADYLWNNKAYDAEKSLKNAMDLLFGAGVYELLRPGAIALAYFDSLQPISPAILEESVPELQAKIDLAKGNFEKAKELSPEALARFSAWYRIGIRRAERVLKAARKPPDFEAAKRKFAKEIAQTEAIAAKTTRIDRKRGDRFFSIAGTFGTRGFGVNAHKMFEGDNRFVGALYGADTAYHTATLDFQADASGGPLELHICAADDERDDSCGLRVTLNDTVIFDSKGEVFPNKKYSVLKVAAPANLLRGKNRLRITNPAPGDNPRGVPWVCLNYIVIKREK